MPLFEIITSFIVGLLSVYFVRSASKDMDQNMDALKEKRKKIEHLHKKEMGEFHMTERKLTLHKQDD